MKLTYNKATKQHGFEDKTVCPHCGKEFILNTMDKNLFGKAICLECFMNGKSNDK